MLEQKDLLNAILHKKNANKLLSVTITHYIRITK